MEGKRNRRPNWSPDETLLLTSLVKQKRHIIKGKFSDGVTASAKKEAWKWITYNLNSSNSSVRRTEDEVEKKWHNILVKAKSAHSDFMRESNKTGGGPAPKPLDTISEAVCDIIGKESRTLNGIPGGVDTCDLQAELMSSFVSIVDVQDLPPVSSIHSLTADEINETCIMIGSADQCITTGPCLVTPTRPQPAATSTPAKFPSREYTCIERQILEEQLKYWKLRNQLLEIELKNKQYIGN